jgi:adenylate cyclase
VAAVVAGSRLSALLFPLHGALTVRPYAIVAAIGVVLGAFATQWSPVTRLEWALYDVALKRAAAGQPPAPGIVVVAIDEPSFTEIGMPWPWPRSLHARLVDRLAAAGAKTIAFDIVFDVPAQNPSDDEAFADAVRRAGNVILATDQADVQDRDYGLTQWTDPIPLLADAAAGLGVVRVPYDPDNVLRRAWLSLDGRPSLATAIASHGRGHSTGPGATLENREPELFRFDGEPRQGVVTVSYYQALDPAALPADIFKGKDVLVGRSLAATTIDERADHFTTPVSARMPGVEVHATILDAIVRGRFVADPFRNRLPIILFAVLASAAVSAAMFRLGPAIAPVLALSVIGLLTLGESIALDHGLRIPVATPAVAIVATYATTAVYRFSLLSRERRMIKRAFQHYVAPAVVDQMLADPSRLRLGGSDYQVTILFSDLEGFTTISEQLGPAALTAHLGEYFKHMLDELLAQRGTLDKLIGDSIMVYFGCPVPDSAHAHQACLGALGMQKQMIELNARWTAKGLPPLRTRIGINTGHVVAGNMGTDTIFNYTIFGDAVNLASRLEGLNKEYGTLTIVGEETWKRVHDAFEGRELDWVRVKGKTRPVAIYELVAEPGQLPADSRELFRQFADGLAHYREARWNHAAAAFARALAIDPQDRPSKLFLSRIEKYRQHAPDHWDGVHVMTSK